MSASFALAGARIFDGDAWHDDEILVVHGDTVEGLAGAQAAGMHAFVFTDAAQAEQDLASLGVELTG